MVFFTWAMVSQLQFRMLQNSPNACLSHSTLGVGISIKFGKPRVSWTITTKQSNTGAKFCLVSNISDGSSCPVVPTSARHGFVASLNKFSFLSLDRGTRSSNYDTCHKRYLSHARKVTSKGDQMTVYYTGEHTPLTLNGIKIYVNPITSYPIENLTINALRMSY